MSLDIVARLVRWHTAMADEPKRAESKRTKHRETADLIEQQAEELAALRERADRNQEDAERYRWLRDTDIAVVAWIEEDGPRWSIEGRDGHNITRDKLDAAIDAARRK